MKARYILPFLIFTIWLASLQHAIAQHVLERAHALYAQRSQADSLETAIELLKNYTAANNKYDAWVLLSRAYYFLGEKQDDKHTKRAVYEKGVQAGEKAMLLVPGYKQEMEKRKGDEEAALKAIPKDSIAALYWTAANIARLGKYSAFTQKVRLKSRIRYLWDRVHEVDPAYNYGGAYRFFGGYFALVPSITGEQDTEKSKEMFDKSLEIAPEYLETKVLYAEAYCTHSKISDRELFRKLLNAVIEADVDAHPDIRPENARAQEKAKNLLEAEEELF